MTQSTTEIQDAADAPITDAGETEAGAPAPTQTFADFDIHPDIVAALADGGIVSPFPIQSMTLPVALGGHDIIGQAKTGTGKTLGFGIPMLNRIVAPGDPGFAELTHPGKPQALAIAPTRELAVQVAGDIERAGKRRGIRVATVYGGRAYEPQIATLREGVEIVVGTPGRLIDLSKQGHLDLSQARIVVLDEADEMLDLGFLPDVETLMALTPHNRQTMLFSATMPGAIVALARRYMTQPTHIRAMGDGTENAHTVKATKQFVYRAHSLDKVEMIARILQAEGRGLTIIFSRTKRTAAKVADELVERGFAAAALHGDLGQGAREQALRAFRKGKVDVLVATDVAARGIDVEHVTHVINYQCPEDEKTYVHRIGRTGRAGNAGVAVTLVDWDDLHRWALINKTLDLGIPEPEETYSSSENLFTDLHIPADAKGHLRKSQQTRAGLDAEEIEDLGETGKHTSKTSHHHGGHDGSSSGHRPRRESGEENRPRRNRNRRRTRGGGTAGAATSSPQAAPSTEPRHGEQPARADREDARPRRRRRRGGPGRSGSTATPGTSTDAS